MNTVTVSSVTPSGKQTPTTNDLPLLKEKQNKRSKYINVNRLKFLLRKNV